MLGNPQNHLNIIHVAGSKGKGSTCAMTAAILSKAGYKVGLYTSPHLNNYRERIRVLGTVSAEVHPPKTLPSADEEDIFPDMIGEPELCAMLELMQPHIARVREKKALGELSFFELFTALAFCYFRHRQVDWVVLETGMGGRLDATNVAPSRICAITPVSLEHTQFLGDTVAKIAGEKAAIIKDPGQKVVIAPQEETAQDVLEKRCAQFSIRPVWIGKDIRLEILQAGERHACSLQNPPRQIVRTHGTKEPYPDLELSLAGEHQAVNAAVVVGIMDAIGGGEGCGIAPEAVRAGLRGVFWPGRLEVLSRDPWIVLDCAHNQASALNLVESLRRIFPGKSVTLVLGVSRDKDITGICRELNRIAETVIVTRAGHPRAYCFPEGELNDLFPGKTRVRTENIEQAVESARRQTAKEGIILIAGSVFLAGEARRFLSLKNVNR